jgi:D-alanyl-D-alanine endopeptidase (penicillin-binding protein 7)
LTSEIAEGIDPNVQATKVLATLNKSSHRTHCRKPVVNFLFSVLVATSLFAIGAEQSVGAGHARDQRSIARASNPRRDATPALKLSSAAALVADDHGRRVYAKHSADVKPIASITKLMTAMVVLDARLPMEERISILDVDRDRLRNSRSRLRTGQATLSRKELLTIALMSSENRAASALGRTSLPGGTGAFVAAMNRKARSIGMTQSHFADASGLSGANRSTAEDLVKMLQAAARYPFIRRATTTAQLTVSPYASGATLEYRNTNPLIRNANPEWDIQLSKTGYINEAGRCLTMQIQIGGRTFYIVLLNADGKLTPFGDSNRVRKWLESKLRENQTAAGGKRPARVHDLTPG